MTMRVFSFNFIADTVSAAGAGPQGYFIASARHVVSGFFAEHFRGFWMTPIQRRIASITEDRRADYLFDTKAAAAALGVHPNKFSDWWFRTRGKLIELYQAQPGQTAAELAVILAEAHREQAKQAAPATRRA